MANGKAQKVLRKALEGEHLAANALAVALGKVNQTEVRDLLSQVRQSHESNIQEVGEKLLSVGGKYPIPELREQLKKGWESIANSKNAVDAVKLLQKKERESLVTYKDLLKKAGDQDTSSLILRNMATTTENIAKLSDSLVRLQAKKKGFSFFPLFVLVAAAGAGAYVYRQLQAKPASAEAPTTPAS